MSLEDDPPATSRARRIQPSTLALGLVLATYVVLVLLGATTSSIGADPLRQDPHHPHGLELGHPQSIRSDEYLTESPISLGWITAGGQGIRNPLNEPPNFFHQLPSGPVSAVVFFDGTAAMLGPWLPDSMLFAARWWLPTLLLLVALPVWFRQVTGSRRWGYLCAAVILFAPANAWWSGRPVNTLGFMFAGAALMLAAQDAFRGGRAARGLSACVLAAILMARFPSYYQPFAIILGFPVLVSTLVFMVSRDTARRAQVVTVVTTGVLGALFTAGTMLENLGPIKAGLDTVYPGKRISTGEALSFGKVFGAPVLGGLEGLQKSMSGTNASEASSAFVVLFVAAAVLWLGRGWHGSTPAHRVFVVWMAFTAFWLAWCTVSFGSLGSHLPLANLVPAFRAANDVGFLATVAFFLLMAHWRPDRAWRAAPFLAAAATGFVTLLAGMSWRSNGLPGLSLAQVWIGAALAAAVVLVLLLWPGRWFSWSATVVAVAALTVQVNPLVFGLGDLRSSTTAQSMVTAGRVARDTGTLWASDDSAFDALMFATATPALSGRQQIGPNRREWLRLDPDGSHENMWNRGGTFVRFRWSDQSGISWANPSPDQVLMTMSPCTLASLEPTLTRVVSRRPLPEDCVRLEERLRWSGRPRFVYAVLS
jgi:hypothetical protein